MKVVTHADFARMLCSKPGLVVKYHRNRWSLYAEAVDMLAGAAAAQGFENPRRVLEVGPFHFPMVPGCLTQDVRENWGADLVADARLEWPPPVTETLDMVVALQVFEHLGGDVEARTVFEQAWKRMVEGGVILISIPYRWPESAGDTHAGIDWQRVLRWCGSRVPVDLRVVGDGLQRMLILFVKREAAR